MKDTEKQQTVIHRLIQWAESQESIRAMLLYGSRANPEAAIDIFSDYDVLLAVTNVHRFFADDHWLDDFGRVLVVFRNPIGVHHGFESFGFITHYEEGVKIDYGFYPTEYLTWAAKESKLPDDLDNGYLVLLDKDRLTEKLQPPTYTAYTPAPPTKQEYVAVIEEFFNDSAYVAKHLWRDNLFSVKLSLDYIMKFHCLRKILEWRMGIDHNWLVKPGAYGKGLKKRIEPEVWSELETTYVGAGSDENWDALFGTIGLFRKVASEVADHLGYAYPYDMDQRVVTYLNRVRNKDENEHREADEQNDLPARERIQALLEIIAPGSSLSAIRPLAGSYSNSTHLVEALVADGSRINFVVRRYVHGNRAKKSRVEFRTLTLLQEHSVPAPVPLYLDDNGAVLGVPGIVTGYVSGKQLMLPADHPSGPLDWARSLATMLAKIHSIPCDSAKGFLLDANSEATWFLRSGVVPDYMKAHPDGAMIWQTVHDLLPNIQQVEPALVHLDYWRGNVLWDQGQITAVVDWEEAAYGDPGIDVAYCRMEMVIMGMMEESENFLSVYEAVMGQQVANLGFWELAAAARPMTDMAGWITEPSKEERFRQFIADAKRSLGGQC